MVEEYENLPDETLANELLRTPGKFDEDERSDITGSVDDASVQVRDGSVDEMVVLLQKQGIDEINQVHTRGILIRAALLPMEGLACFFAVLCSALCTRGRHRLSAALTTRFGLAVLFCWVTLFIQSACCTMDWSHHCVSSSS